MKVYVNTAASVLADEPQSVGYGISLPHKYQNVIFSFEP
jgi:hypothetical protein